MMFSNVSVKFNQYAVTLENENDDFLTCDISFSVYIKNIDTGNPDRGNHLRSGDFFDAEKFPTTQFMYLSVKAEEPENYKMTG